MVCAMFNFIILSIFLCQISREGKKGITRKRECLFVFFILMCFDFLLEKD